MTAFHKDYKMTNLENTPSKTLLRAAEIGREAGLSFVYAGNLPGRVEEYEDTHCPHCNRTLIRRHGYVIGEYHITGQGTCPSCGTKVAGVWPENPKAVKEHYLRDTLEALLTGKEVKVPETFSIGCTIKWKI